MIEKLPPITLDLPAQLDNIRRRRVPARPCFFEHGLEPGIKEQLCGRFDLSANLDPTDQHYRLRREIALHQFLGCELMRVFPAGINWPGLPTDTTAAPPAVGPIQSWSDFENYPWPKISDLDFSELDWLEDNLPDHIGTWVMIYLFQQVSNLLGFAPMCIMLSENRPLIQAVIEKVARFFQQYAETLCSYDRLVAINVGDDMGHKTGTLISPTDIRALFIPWHRRMLTPVRAHNKLALFHVCGQVDAIMDDLIDTVAIDAKHSTQDVIEPVTTEKQRLGSRIALLGGLDVDVMTRGHPTQIRQYTRNIMEKCLPGGGFALGVGNWVADSIPVDNYLAALDEARRC